MTTRLSLKTETTIHHFDVRKVPVIGPAWRMVDLFRRQKKTTTGVGNPATRKRDAHLFNQRTGITWLLNVIR